MNDTSTEPATSSEGQGTEINADVDSLSIDGTAPEVGDHVDCKVGGTVTKVVNGVATFTAETVNDTPMPAAPSVSEPDKDDSGENLGNMAAMADQSAQY